jgi:hypothetical protein
MKHLTRLRPSPAMVVACLALGIALGGTSYAAIKLPRNSIGTKQLKKNAVTSPKVRNNALTGADVLESSLAKVPAAKAADTAALATLATTATTATTAGNANTVGGATVKRFVVAVPNGAAQATVLDLNGLIITMRCPAGATSLRANNNSGGAAQFRWDVYAPGGEFNSGFTTFGANDNANLNNDNNVGSGSSHYIRLDGTAVTADYGWRNDDLGAAGAACRVFGYAISG